MLQTWLVSKVGPFLANIFVFALHAGVHRGPLGSPFGWVPLLAGSGLLLLVGPLGRFWAFRLCGSRWPVLGVAPARGNPMAAVTPGNATVKVMRRPEEALMDPGVRVSSLPMAHRLHSVAILVQEQKLSVPVRGATMIA